MNPNYHDAESFLDAIADDVPLFTNTREGVYSQDAREAAPAPLESASDVCGALTDMRALLMQRRAQSLKASGNSASSPSAPRPLDMGRGLDNPVTFGGHVDDSSSPGSLRDRAKSFGEVGGRADSKVKMVANMWENNSKVASPASNGVHSITSSLERSSLASEQAELGGISGLQEIDGLQDDELDTSQVSEAPQPSYVPARDRPPATAQVGRAPWQIAAFNSDKGDNPPSLPLRSRKETSKSEPLAEIAQNSAAKPVAGGPSKEALQQQASEKTFAELEVAPSDRRDVNPTVIHGLVKIMHGGTADKRRKATIAMCNLCCESAHNRANAHSAGVVPCLVAMMKDENDDDHLRRLATACICNLSADPPLKDSIASSGAIRYLSKLLDPAEDSVDARAATAHAAATLWSLCVDMEHIKPLVAQEDTLKALLKQLKSPESFVRGQACGCVGEVCIGNKDIKGHLSRLGAIPDLIALLDEPEHATQRLSASALCNLLANHDSNKKLARECGLLEAFSRLLKATQDEAVQSAAAGGLYNLVSATDRKRLESLGVVDLLRKVPISKHINVRLGIKDAKK